MVKMEGGRRSGDWTVTRFHPSGSPVRPEERRQALVSSDRCGGHKTLSGDNCSVKDSWR